MWILLVAVSAGFAGWRLVQLRRMPAVAPGRAIARPPAATIRTAAVSAVWHRHANGCECAHARAGGSGRLTLEEVQQLMHNGNAGCRCQFSPLPEQRRQARRQALNRRAELRFDLKRIDRRRGDRRRACSVWERTLGF